MKQELFNKCIEYLQLLHQKFLEEVEIIEYGETCCIWSFHEVDPIDRLLISYLNIYSELKEIRFKGFINMIQLTLTEDEYDNRLFHLTRIERKYKKNIWLENAFKNPNDLFKKINRIRMPEIKFLEQKQSEFLEIFENVKVALI